MSTPSASANSLKSACKVFVQDLQALPEESFTKRFGPSTRTVADIVYEVILVNDHIGMVIRGEEPFPWPEGGWITAPDSFSTKKQVLAGFEKSSEKAISTAEGIAPEALSSTVHTERGETTLEERIRFMTLHLWYHSGQLNFIQTLLGDSEWHWN